MAAGLFAAGRLASRGFEALVRRLSAMPGLFEGLVILHDSFAGLAGGRHALAILGVVPVLYSAAEVKAGARQVLQQRWPQLVLFEDVMVLVVASFGLMLSARHSGSHMTVSGPTELVHGSTYPPGSYPSVCIQSPPAFLWQCGRQRWCVLPASSSMKSPGPWPHGRGSPGSPTA